MHLLFYCLVGSTVDVSRLFALFSFDVIMRSAFGVESEIQTNPDPDLLQKALTLFDVPLYIRALSMFPFWQRVKKLLDINPIQHVRYFEKLGRNVLEIRKKSPSGRRDLFQLMLEAKKESVSEIVKLTDEEIIAQTIVILAAGFETTGSTLAFTVYYLALHPEIQAKLRQEIEEATRSHSGHALTFDFINGIKYLDRVISEVLRITPIGFVNVRQCNESCVIKGVYFPAGVIVNIPSYAVHHDPAFWPEVNNYNFC